MLYVKGVSPVFFPATSAQEHMRHGGQQKKTCCQGIRLSSESGLYICTTFNNLVRIYIYLYIYAFHLRYSQAFCILCLYFDFLVATVIIFDLISWKTAAEGPPEILE